MRRFVWLLSVVLLGSLVGSAGAQAIRLDDGPLSAAPPRQHVELVSQSVRAESGKASWVELRFRVAPGFHINSHTPHDELLLPTRFESAPDGPKVVRQEYPAGIPLHLEVGDGEVLSTYQGEFAVRLEMVAAPDHRELVGTLHYQACDAHSCFPPRHLPVKLPVVAR